MDFAGKNITVLGAGRSGSAAAHWLKAQGACVTISDILSLEKWPLDLKAWCEDSEVRMESGGHREETITGSQLLVVSPGVPMDAPPIEWAMVNSVPVFGELALAISQWKGPIVAITGTNGKTTTTKLLGVMMEKAGIRHVVAGNVGTPLISCMDKNSEDTVAVIEVSSFQLDYIPFQGEFFKIAAWLNLSPDHLDRYPSLSAYGESKARILELQGEKDWAVLNYDDENLNPWRECGRADRFFFSFRPLECQGAWFNEKKGILKSRLSKNHSEEYSLERWGLKGRHNLENLAAALLMARLSGVDPASVQETIDTFKAPSHRLQYVGYLNGVLYYDDSKATNVTSSLKAIQAIKEKIVLLAGGRGKGEDYSPLRAAAEEGRLRAVVVLGEEGEAMEKVFKGIVHVARINGSDDGEQVMRDAVIAAINFSKEGDVVLLAPACASFDLFNNYEERGKAFQKALEEL